MSTLDSQAVFPARAKEMGLLDAEAARLQSKGWNTLALLAFACSYTPGQADDANLVRLGALITGSGASDPPEDRMPVVIGLTAWSGEKCCPKVLVGVS